MAEMSYIENNNLQDTFQISNYKLSRTDKKVFHLLIEHPELTQIEVAEKLNMTPHWICKRIGKPGFQQALNDFETEWVQIILRGKYKAARKLLLLIDCKNSMVSLRACEDILQLNKVDLFNTVAELDNFTIKLPPEMQNTP